MLENIKEQKNRYRIVCLKNDEDYILKHLHEEVQGNVVYMYDKIMFLNIIYDTDCDDNIINNFITNHLSYLATFEVYEKKYD